MDSRVIVGYAIQSKFAGTETGAPSGRHLAGARAATHVQFAAHFRPALRSNRTGPAGTIILARALNPGRPTHACLRHLVTRCPGLRTRAQRPNQRQCCLMCMYMYTFIHMFIHKHMYIGVPIYTYMYTRNVVLPTPAQPFQG
eukprot:366560-Chlamydomonas_euryale.AAC.4